jgi:hypothetical protein
VTVCRKLVILFTFGLLSWLRQLGILHLDHLALKDDMGGYNDLEKITCVSIKRSLNKQYIHTLSSFRT